ncbi:MAG: DNA replication/repair protein RecF [Steroidobacteraceae bacterium]
MTLSALEVRDFRCIAHAQLDFDPRFTLISGENASGKTSLLEALYFLSCGRSFRSPQLEPLIRGGRSEFMVVGQVQGALGQVTSLGVRGSRVGSEIRLGGQPASGFAQMAGLLPAQVIDPEVHRLVEDGPTQRRRYLDWGVFHVEPGFVGAMRRYQRALRQRNAALKAKRPAAEVRLWDPELLDSGVHINEQRLRYVSLLAPFVAEFGRELLGLDVEISLQQGWGQDKTLSSALEDAWSRDVLRGATSVGTHRADVLVRVDGRPAKDRISRGQQKLLASSLLLAQIQHRATLGGPETALLLDDPAAELDVDNLRRLLDLVARVPAQLIVTALDPSRLNLRLPGRAFHVEQGKVAPVVYSVDP